MRALLLALTIAITLAGAPLARATTGTYFCTQLNIDNTCAAWATASDGLATFEDLGITPEAITEAIAFGLGAVIASFALGLGMGAAIRVVQSLGE